MSKDNEPVQHSITAFVWIVFIGLVVLGYFQCKSCFKVDSSEASTVSTRDQKIKDQFSAWDGSHVAMERAIKKIIRDPKSYEHIESTYIDLTDRMLVCT